MTAVVILTTWSGMVPAAVATYSGQKVENAVWLLKQPYLAKEAITLTNASATSSASPLSADNNVKLLRVEVQQGKRVQYEVNPPGLDARTATSSSPILYGEEMISFGPGWLISLIEAS